MAKPFNKSRRLNAAMAGRARQWTEKKNEIIKNPKLEEEIEEDARTIHLALKQQTVDWKTVQPAIMRLEKVLIEERKLDKIADSIFRLDQKGPKTISPYEMQQHLRRKANLMALVEAKNKAKARMQAEWQ